MRAIYHYGRSYFGGIWGTPTLRTKIDVTARKKVKTRTVRKRRTPTEFTVVRRDKITPGSGDKD